VHVSAPDGRTLTVRYCRIGALMGILSLYSEPFVMPATRQAVLDAEILVMNPAVVRRLAERDVRVANALLRELRRPSPVGRRRSAGRGQCSVGLPDHRRVAGNRSTGGPGHQRSRAGAGPAPRTRHR
jgi:hypothetical protein